MSSEDGDKLAATFDKASVKINRWFSTFGQKTSVLLSRHKTTDSKHQQQVMPGKTGHHATSVSECSQSAASCNVSQSALYNSSGYNSDRSNYLNKAENEACHSVDVYLSTDEDVSDSFEDDDDNEAELNSTVIDSSHALTVYDLPVKGRLMVNRRLPDTTDTESIVSDYSEIAEPLREHLANMHSDCYREDCYTCGGDDDDDDGPLMRYPGECDEDFERRAKKVNYLSLAQEFAALKRVDPSALPFDMHKDNDARSCSDYSISDKDSVGQLSLQSTSFATGSSSDDCVLNNHRQHSLSVDSGLVEPPAEYRDSADAAVFTSDCRNEQKRETSCSVTDAKLSPARTNRDSNTLRGKLSSENLIKTDVKNNVLSSPKKAGASSKSSENANDIDAFDVYSIETALPQLDWKRLEEAILVKNNPENKFNGAEKSAGDREEIRRKLAMGSVDDDYDDDDYVMNRVTKRMQLAPSRQLQQSGLQMCYMNEAADVANSSKKVMQDNVTPMANGVASNNMKQKMSTVCPVISEPHHCQPQNDEDYFYCQEQLQQQARQALAQVKPLAQMQLALEKRSKKKSPIAEMVGIPDVMDRKTVTRRRLLAMNTAQLQVLLNELHTQIESLNDDLVQQLMLRDDLHMEQDSMLVDIEDLHRRAQEFSERSNGGSKRGKTAMTTK